MFQNWDGQRMNTLKNLAMELFKLEGKGKSLGKKFDGFWRILKEAPKCKGGRLRLCSGLFGIEA